MPVSRKNTLCRLSIGMAVLISMAGCGNDNAKREEMSKKALADFAARQASADVRKYSYSDGADICFRKVKEKLGDLAMVNTISSGFDAKSNDGKQRPTPVLDLCTVQYQDPQNPKKLLKMAMDTHTGEFAAPRPMQLTIIGGDPEKFKLETVLIPLKSVNASTVPEILEKNNALLDAKLSERFFKYLDLRAPGILEVERTHTLTLTISGKYKSNDEKASIAIITSPDGKKILRNDLRKT